MMNILEMQITKRYEIQHECCKLNPVAAIRFRSHSENAILWRISLPSRRIKPGREPS